MICAKIFDKEQMKDHHDARVSALKKEVEILRNINHKNIVKFLDFIEDSRYYYIFMELCRGDSLMDFVNRSTSLSEHTAKNIFYQILDALNHLHSNEIAHRDLKPENIIINANFEVKIIDFGLSTNEASKLRETFCGSLVYVAPESILRTPYLATKSDIWSCGVMLYQILSGGKLPWKSTDITGVIDEILKNPINMPRTISDASSAVLKKMLERDPNQRASAQQLLDDDWFKESKNQGLFHPNTAIGRRKTQIVANRRSTSYPIIFPSPNKSPMQSRYAAKRNLVFKGNIHT
jgi:serine/threonine protein kinase